MHWGESVCGGRGAESKPEPGRPPSRLPPVPRSIATRQPAALGRSARRGPPLVPGASRERRVAGEGGALEGGHAGPSRVSGGTKKQARAGGAGSRLSWEGLERERDPAAPRASRRSGTRAPPLEGARGTAVRGRGGRPWPDASAARSRGQVSPRPRLGPPPGCGMIDLSLTANRTALVRARGRGGAGPAPGAERYLRRAAGLQEAGAAGASRRRCLCALASLGKAAGREGVHPRAPPRVRPERSQGTGVRRVGRPARPLGTPSSRFPCSGRCLSPRPVADARRPPPGAAPMHCALRES